MVNWLLLLLLGYFLPSFNLFAPPFIWHSSDSVPTQCLRMRTIFIPHFCFSSFFFPTLYGLISCRTQHGLYNSELMISWLSIQTTVHQFFLLVFFFVFFADSWTDCFEYIYRESIVKRYHSKFIQWSHYTLQDIFDAKRLRMKCFYYCWM